MCHSRDVVPGKDNVDYQIEQEDGKWRVYRKKDGKMLKEYDTRPEAMKEVKRLIAEDAKGGTAELEEEDEE